MAALTLDRVKLENNKINAEQITRIQLNNSDLCSVSDLRLVTVVGYIANIYSHIIGSFSRVSVGDN